MSSRQSTSPLLPVSEQGRRKEKELGDEVRHSHSTKDIIKSIEKGTFPHQVMITVHPQRWTNDPVLWTQELVLQNVKNVVKRMLIAGKNM